MGDAVRVDSVFPIIGTRDLPRLRTFYCDVLGGRVAYEFPGPDDAIVYTGIDIGASHLGIAVDDGLDTEGAGQVISLWLYVADCDAAVRALRDAGATITEEPADQPWGERVARALDPDGNALVLGAKPA